jgi:hypothetical protein
MNKDVTLLIDQIKAIENMIAEVQANYMDFGKETKLKQLNNDKQALLDRLTKEISNNSSDLKVNGSLSKDFYYILKKEIDNLEITRTDTLNRYFRPDYIIRYDRNLDPNYIAKVKPFDDCIKKYKDMSTFVSLINTTDQVFTEAMKTLYNVDVDVSEVGSLESRIKFLMNTELADVIYDFYNVISLETKMDGVQHNLMQRDLFSSTLIECNLKPTLYVDKLNLSRVQCYDLLNELYPIFDPAETKDVPLTLWHVRELYNYLEEYVKLCDAVKTSNKIMESLENVKNDSNIKGMLEHYKELSKEMLDSKSKGNYQTELDRLTKKKSILGFIPQKRTKRINKLQISLQNNIDIAKQLYGKTDEIFQAYFKAIRKELENRELAPKDVSNYEKWSELSNSIEKDIADIISSMRIDDATKEFTTNQVISQINLPFTVYASKAEDRMNEFKKRYNIKQELDINKALTFINLYKNFKWINSGVSISAITPYAENDIVQYYITKSMTNINTEYPKFIAEDVKTQQK